MADLRRIMVLLGLKSGVGDSEAATSTAPFIDTSSRSSMGRCTIFPSRDLLALREKAWTSGVDKPVSQNQKVWAHDRSTAVEYDPAQHCRLPASSTGRE